MPILTASLLLFILALMITSIGFRNPVHFVSIGYAFAIVGMAIVTTGIYFQQFNFLALLQKAVLLIWGLRLGLFLINREAKPGFQKTKAAIDARYGIVSLPVKAATWVSVSLLYVLMFSPALYASAATPESGWAVSFWQVFGLLIMLASLGIEALADRQKSLFKQAHPGDFCNTGLYARMRCPNYFAEISIWFGSWIMGIPFYTTALRWIFALIGLVCITLIMIGSTKRLEQAQAKRYGERSDFQAYVNQVPVLIPFVPIYSLLNVKAIIE